jgi:hypothetical protein
MMVEESKRFDGADLKLEEWKHKQGMQIASRYWKRQENGLHFRICRKEKVQDAP